MALIIQGAITISDGISIGNACALILSVNPEGRNLAIHTTAYKNKAAYESGTPIYGINELKSVYYIDEATVLAAPTTGFTGNIPARFAKWVHSEVSKQIIAANPTFTTTTEL